MSTGELALLALVCLNVTLTVGYLVLRARERWLDGEVARLEGEIERMEKEVGE